MHSAPRTLVCDEAAIAAAVTIRHGAIQGLRDQLALVGEKNFAGHKDHFDSEPREVSLFLSGLKAHQVDGAWIAENGPALSVRQQLQVSGHYSFAHFKGRQQSRRKYLVPEI